MNNIKHSLKVLSKSLRDLNLIKYSEEVDSLEYEEPWHEEAVTEFGSEPISEEEELSSLESNLYYEEDEIPKHVLNIVNEIGAKLVSVNNSVVLGDGVQDC